MSDLTHSASIVIAATPEELYDLVADVSNMGEWSPVCRRCEYDDGAGPEVGATFTGHNELPDRQWDTRSTIVAAERPREFAWVVTERQVARWGYTFEPVDGGTLVTESWEFLPGGHEFFRERYGDDAAAEIEERRRLATLGIPETLAAIKRSAEG